MAARQIRSAGRFRSNPFQRDYDQQGSWYLRSAASRQRPPMDSALRAGWRTSAGHSL